MKNNITVIAGTNRKGSNTLKFAQYYSRYLEQKNIEHTLFPLIDLPLSLFHPEMYDSKNEEFIALQEKYVVPANKFIFILPEYNGSVPGAFKFFIDACQIPRCFHGKKAALIGLAAGKGGNIRGLEHATGIMHHIKVNVFYNKFKISSFNEEFKNGELLDAESIKHMEGQLNGFLEY